MRRHICHLPPRLARFSSNGTCVRHLYNISPRAAIYQAPVEPRYGSLYDEDDSWCVHRHAEFSVLPRDDMVFIMACMVAVKVVTGQGAEDSRSDDGFDGEGSSSSSSVNSEGRLEVDLEAVPDVHAAATCEQNGDVLRKRH